MAKKHKPSPFSRGKVKRTAESGDRLWIAQIMADSYERLRAGEFKADSLRAFAQRFYQSRLEQNYSPNSVYAMGDNLSRFFDWCEDRGITDLAQVVPAVVEAYQRALFEARKPNGEPLSATTQAQYLIVIRHFFSWCTRRRFMLYNPAAEIEMPRRVKRLPSTVLTEKEVERVMRMIDETTPGGLRNRAILETLYSTGMRRAELSRLALGDLDRERGTIYIRYGKGHRDRHVPIGEPAIHWIDRYVTEARSYFLPVDRLDPGFLFLRHGGKPINADSLSGIVKKALRRAKVDKKGSCHLFRHAMATHLLEHGADVRFIQAILGHAELSTTEIYTRVSIGKLKEIHTNHHPRAARTEEKPKKKRLKLVAGGGNPQEES